MSVKTYGSWRDVADLARVTVGLDPGAGEPTQIWKIRMLLAEHSPIRALNFNVLLSGIKSWVSVHLVRHKYGVEHYVRTQRSDRTGVDRGRLPQGSLVDHAIHANAQAIINISRKRLCAQASEETRAAWRDAVDQIATVSPELAAVCVPDCIYRGWCYEIKPCGYAGTKQYSRQLETYRRSTKMYEEGWR